MNNLFNNNPFIVDKTLANILGLKEASRKINIKNTIAYLKTCICNSINEMKIEVDANLRFNGVI